MDTYARWLFAALGVAVPACGGDSESGGSGNAHPCKDPQPLLVNGQPTGVESCGPGAVRRREALTCPEAMPRVNPCTATNMNCSADTDCNAGPHGYCAFNQGGGGAPSSCNCNYGCTNDSECADGQRCLCGDPVGRCVPAACSTSSDCQSGFDCVTPVGACSAPSLNCQTKADECSSDDDCPTTGYCGVGTDGQRVCTMNGCAGLGRPFLVEGAARLAEVCARRDYAKADVLTLAGLTRAERLMLAEHWTRVGLMEHASVAAFARFTLQLLALGAPAELVRQSCGAQADETEHAMLAFAFASAYAESPLGPGPLDMSGALPPLDARQVLGDVIREGCIGETLAAVEAEHGAEHAADPAVRAALSGIARDETRHAALAWRFVGWLLDAQPELRAFARAELARAAAEVRAGTLPPARDGAEKKRALGMIDERERAELQRDALERVVVPAATALLGAPAERTCAPA